VRCFLCPVVVAAAMVVAIEQAPAVQAEEFF
jgi:hypothetical protein